MGLFAVTVFLSAFLLFQIQPIVAKMILPWFGGSSSVWSVCLVFFQVLSGPDGRRLYAAVASYHAYLEYPLLVLLAASLVRRRTSSGRNRS